ncbi:MAG TPA: cation diffusion facilitator family transporter [Tepidisphaeraceae bacterium]|nr:cation diffusion facilitator family transporter [Tepidisphaeraceae bacterium]
MHHRTLHPQTAALEVRAAVGSLVVGIVLMVTKFVAYALTDSAAIFSDAIESIVNVLAGGFAVYAVVLAHRPADESHPYGHGKVEFLAAGFEGGMILLAAIFIAWRGVEVMITGQRVQRIDAGLGLIVLAMVVNAAMGVMLTRLGKKHGSITLEADGKHLQSDAITSVAVLVSLILVRLTDLHRIDAVCALLVAGYLVWIAIDLLKRSAAGLMDAQDTADARLLRTILDAHVAPSGNEPLICSYHKLRHRHSGRYHWVDFQLVVPASMKVDQGHQIASEIEGEIERALGAGDATAHVEPCISLDCPRCHTPSKNHVS